MPNFSGIWNLKEQVQAIAAGRWTGLPGPQIWSFGLNSSGQLGDETVANKSSPVQVGLTDNWSEIAAGTSHSLALKETGTLWAWGDNANGRLGDGSVVLKSSPVQIGALTTWSKIDNGTQSIALKTDGTVWCWGLNANGQVGDNTTVSKSSPVQVGALTNWVSHSSGQQHTLALLGVV